MRRIVCQMNTPHYSNQSRLTESFFSTWFKPLDRTDMNVRIAHMHNLLLENDIFPKKGNLKMRKIITIRIVRQMNLSRYSNQSRLTESVPSAWFQSIDRTDMNVYFAKKGNLKMRKFVTCLSEKFGRRWQGGARLV